MLDAVSLNRFYRQVEQANATLTAQWRVVSEHLRDGLSAPVASSAVLRKAYVQPHQYPAPDGRMHRKPARALYGLGDGARQRFEGDLAFYHHYCEGIRAQVERDNAAVDYWVEKARSGDPKAIGWYCKTVLPLVLAPVARSYIRTAYLVEEVRTLVIDRWVPGIEMIPEAQRYEVRGARSNPHSVAIPTQTRDLWYLSFLAQVVLLTAHRVFLSEISNAVDLVIINCLTTMRNPATGHDETITVLSVKVAKDRLARVNLAGVNPIDCVVVQLEARVSKDPGEFSPIRPFASTDQGLMTATVTGIPLMAIDPTAFENLVTELLRRMGLRATSTGRTGDGGIDCEAYDDRPVVGGKVIVQVKRYTNIVPPSVVRDLFGTVHASGATKGVLVTTSGFGPESRAFVQGKPLELIDGVQLDALLRQYQLVGGEAAAAISTATSPLQPQSPNP